MVYCFEGNLMKNNASGTDSHPLCADWWKELQPGRSQSEQPSCKHKSDLPFLLPTITKLDIHFCLLTFNATLQRSGWSLPGAWSISELLFSASLPSHSNSITGLDKKNPWYFLQFHFFQILSGSHLAEYFQHLLACWLAYLVEDHHQKTSLPAASLFHTLQVK